MSNNPPAEQGQERDRGVNPKTTRITTPEGRAEWYRQECERLRAELEMCQRYFPFMRRSRDEAVRKLFACQERHRNAETARDEAVKREKALREALENALAADTESETRHIIYAALDQSGKP